MYVIPIHQMAAVETDKHYGNLSLKGNRRKLLHHL